MIWRFRERQAYRPGLNIGYAHRAWRGGPWRAIVLYVPGLVTARVWFEGWRPRDLHTMWWREGAP